MDITKACNLTEDEIKQLIYFHCDNMRIADGIERINYLNKRLKAFNEVKNDTSDFPKDGW
jgi:hypothetical protein